MTHAEIRAAISPLVAVTCTLFGEAAGESLTGQAAVAAVIRNRVRHPRWWGKDWKGVCHGKWQFSCWWETSPNTDRVYALAEALMRRQAATGPQSVVGQLEWVAAGVMDDVLLDPTRGADHYLTTALLRSKPPTWAKGQVPVAVVDDHTFFRLEI